MGSAIENSEEGIAFSRKLDTPMLGNRSAYDPGLLLQTAAELFLPELLQELRGALDIGEEKGYGPRRQVFHGSDHGRRTTGRLLVGPACEQVARPGPAYAGLVLLVGQRAGLEREASAADTSGELVPELFEFLDAPLEGRPPIA